MFRVLVSDDDKSHADIRGNTAQELLQGFQSSGGSTDSDHKKLFCYMSVFSAVRRF